MYSNKPDTEILLDGFTDVLNSMGECLNSTVDETKTKRNVIGNVFSFTVSLTKFSWNLGICAIKNTPKVVTTIAAVKREVIEEVENNYYQHKKQIKIDALDEKIKTLKIKNE